MPVGFLGIPWLASILGGFFLGIAQFFLQWFTKRWAIILAVAAIFATLTATFFTAIQVALATLVVAAPAELTLAAQLFLPENIDECLSALIAGHVARFAYEWNVRIIQYRLL